MTILIENFVVEVDQGANWDVFSSRIILENGLDGLLDLCRWHSLVIFSGSLWHVKIELEDVIKLVSRIEVTKSLGDSRIFRRWSLESNCRLWTLIVLFLGVDLSWMVDNPVVILLVPCCDLLILSELFGRDEVIDDHILQL